MKHLKHSLMAASIGAALIAFPAQAQQLRFMTGPQGGAWYPLGGAMAAMGESLGASIQVLPGGGIANVQGIQNGDADLGLGNSISTVDAIHGRAPFDGEADNVCNIATLLTQYFQVVVVRDDITQVEDFAGRRLNTQPVGNTAEQATRNVLEIVGLSYDDLSAVDYVSYSDGVSLMQDNNSDIFTLGATIPSAPVMDLAQSSGARVMPLDDDFVTRLRESINPGYSAATIPAGTYPGQDEDVSTVSYAGHLVGRCDLDADFVEGLLGQIWENRADLAAIAAAIGDIDLESMAQDIGVPMHEGALAFYEANGITP